MATALHQSPIYGPVHSRRIGISLGINLMPADGKACTFDCIYCECGFNAERKPHLPRPTREQVRETLEHKLMGMQQEGTAPDVLTFAGNGEPTSHPQFAEIIDDTIALRDKYFPQAKVSVLSNATFAHRPEVHQALMRVDNNILKLDTCCDEYIKMVDRPTSSHYSVNDIINTLASFKGHVIIQTMFMKGTFERKNVDNTTDTYVTPWLKALRHIAPQEVMIYTIDRDMPAPKLTKASRHELNIIRDRVAAMGIACTASY